MKITYKETVERFVTIDIPDLESDLGPDELERLYLETCMEYAALNGWDEETATDSCISVE